MWDPKMRALFLGMSVATVVGLSAGGAMKPVTTDFFGGPKTEIAASARRAAPSWNEAVAWTSYGGNIPDYVIGTDWITPSGAMEAGAPEPEPEARPPEPAPAPAPVVKVVAVEPAPPPTQYPSTSGDILAGMDSYAPPTPPADDAPPNPPPVD